MKKTQMIRAANALMNEGIAMASAYQPDEGSDDRRDEAKATRKAVLRVLKGLSARHIEKATKDVHLRTSS